MNKRENKPQKEAKTQDWSQMMSSSMSLPLIPSRKKMTVKPSNR